MAKNMFFNKYDIFISYPYEIQTKILELYEIFTNSYGLNVMCDLNMSKPVVIPPAVITQLGGGTAAGSTATPEQLPATKILLPTRALCENINNSRLFLLAVQDSLINYEQCEREVYYAIQQKKRILCMMFVSRPLHEYNRFGMLIQNLPKIDFYKDNDILQKWSGSLFDKFIDLCEIMMNKKINRAQNILITGLSISTMSLSSAFKSNSKAQFNVKNDKSATAQQSTRFNQIKSSKPLNIPAKRLSRMSYLQGKRRILYCDVDAHQLLVSDTYGSLQSKQSLQNLKRPYSVCCSRKNEIFIGDTELEKIFVFDALFKFKRSFDFVKLANRFDMTIDNDNEVLYVTVYERNELLVINSTTGELTYTKENILKPSYVKVRDDKIYVISGEERIIVLRSDTYDSLKEIQLDNWCNLRTLYVDSKHNIITTAYEKNFPIAFLFLVDTNGKLLSKVYIHMKEIEDMMVLDDKKFFFNSETSSLCVMEFE